MQNLKVFIHFYPQSIDLFYPPGNWKILLMEDILLTTWDVQNLVNGIYNLPMDQPQVVIAGFLQQYLSFGRKKTSSSSSWWPAWIAGDMFSLPDGITPVDRWRSGPPPKFGLVDFSFSGAMIQQVAVRHRSFPGGMPIGSIGLVYLPTSGVIILPTQTRHYCRANPSKLQYISHCLIHPK